MARRLASIPMVLWLAACNTPPSEHEPGLDHIHERIVRLGTDADGDTWVAFELSARAFVILRADAHLLAFAHEALAAGRPVHATVRSGHGPKTPEAVARPVDADGKQRIAVVALAYEPEAATTPARR